MAIRKGALLRQKPGTESFVLEVSKHTATVLGWRRNRPTFVSALTPANGPILAFSQLAGAAQGGRLVRARTKAERFQTTFVLPKKLHGHFVIDTEYWICGRSLYVRLATQHGRRAKIEANTLPLFVEHIGGQHAASY